MSSDDTANVLRALHSSEAQQITRENHQLIQSLTKQMLEVKDPVKRVQGLVNATSRVFQGQDQWGLGGPNQRRSEFEEFVRGLWLAIPLEVRSEHRIPFATKVIGKCKEADLTQRYWTYLDAVLPT